MENQLLFCVYDSKVEGYLPPFVAINRPVAIRVFETACLQEASDFSQHCEDYSLFEVGHYEPGTGKLVAVAVPKQLIQAQQIINKHLRQVEDHESGI